MEPTTGRSSYAIRFKQKVATAYEISSRIVTKTQMLNIKAQLGGEVKKLTVAEMRFNECHIRRDKTFSGDWLQDAIDKKKTVEWKSAKLSEKVTQTVRENKFLGGNPMNEIQGWAESALTKHMKKNFNVQNAQNAVPAGNPLLEALNVSTIPMLESFSNSKGASLIDQLGGNSFTLPVIGPSDPSTKPATEQDLLQHFVDVFADIGHDLTFDDVRSAKPAVAKIFKGIVDWYQCDSSAFWKTFRPDDKNLDAVEPKLEFTTKALYHLSVVSEHHMIAEGYTVFNPPDSPWIWQLPDDRDNLQKALGTLYKEQGPDAFFDYLQKYRYKDKHVLPRYVACDVAVDALYDVLNVTIGK